MLLQLMVYAKIIYLLMVVISGALCTVEYVIMSKCAHNKAIHIAAEGTVSVTDTPQIQNITIIGHPDFVNNNFKIALLAKETQKYLCFNDHWKLVGMKELQDTCYFEESIRHGYFVFQSVVDLQRQIGFTQRGRAVGPKKTVNEDCYMFSKFPADQFYHRHTHFSTPKTKSTTKIPKTEYTNTPQSVHSGRGSGGGRPKHNRPKNHHRQGETVPNNTNNNNKKNKKQRNGNKQRQQQKHNMQHSYNLSNPKNSTYLNSSRQNLVLSQHSINNDAKQHNHDLPQNHSVRHHHNDPKKVARRQHHDHKQKAKLHHRVTRPSPSAATPSTSATVPILTAIAPTSKQLMTTVHSTKPQDESGTSYAEINPTSVVHHISTIASAHRNTLSSTVVAVTKRKGRRRKGQKMHKKLMQKRVELEREHKDNSAEMMATNSNGRSFTSSIGPSTLASYEEEEDFMTSSTDNGWLNNDIMMSSIQPTSASLPTWETWYPSSPTSVTDEESDYSLSSSVTGASTTETKTETETDDDTWFSSTRESSLMTDIDRNTLSLQTSISLPSAVFSTIQNENDSDETISPTQTTELGQTTTATSTTNTSTYNQSEWSTTTILSDDEEIDAMFATPKLNDGYFEDENSTATSSTTDDQGTVISSFATEEFTEVGDTTSDKTLVKSSVANDDQTSEMYNSMAAAATMPTTYSHLDCANSSTSSLNGSKTPTDCKHSTNTAANIANKHKHCRHRHVVDSVNTEMPKRYSIDNSETKLETEATATATRSTLATTIPTRSEKTITTTLTAELPKSSPLAVLTTQYPSLHKHKHKHEATVATEDNGTPATHSSSTFSTKTLVPSPSTTRKTLRKSTHKLMATQFHQLTYEAGDIDSHVNISMYPELLDNDNDETVVNRLTLKTGYLPRSAKSTLPESIRLAKVKIMSRLRSVGNYA